MRYTTRASEAACAAGVEARPRSSRGRVRSFDAMSPILHRSEIHAPCIVFGHDRDDVLTPIAESRRLAAALAGREGVRFYHSLYPLFRRSS